MTRGRLAPALLILCAIEATAATGVLEHTAIAALRDLRQQPSGDRWEYSGFIVYRDNAYQYSMFPHTDQARDHVRYDITAHLQPSDKLVGIYHNHPCYAESYHTAYFSTPDLISARFFHVPTFLLDNCTGIVHTFDWTRDSVHGSGADKRVFTSDGSSKIVHLASGRLIGNIGITSPDMDVTP